MTSPAVHLQPGRHRPAAYTVVADGPRNCLCWCSTPADGGPHPQHLPLPDAAGFPVGVSVRFDRRVVATSAGQVYSFSPA